MKHQAGDKLAFDIETVLSRVRAEIRGYPKAAMFDLADQGHVSTTSPIQTMTELYTILPQHYWTEINALLVPFGKQ